MEKICFIIVAFVSVFLSAKACKIQIYDPPEEGKTRDFWELNTKGILITISYFLDIFFYESSGDGFFVDLLVASFGSIIGFVIFFYIFYGIMSLLNVSGDDTEDRRSKAFWVLIVLSFIASLVLIIMGDKI